MTFLDWNIFQTDAETKKKNISSKGDRGYKSSHSELCMYDSVSFVSIGVANTVATSPL
jgi:hypothetical protein